MIQANILKTFCFERPGFEIYSACLQRAGISYFHHVDKMPTLSGWIICFFFLAILQPDSSAQTGSRAIITGRIIDAQTAEPLENAIVFLSNTPFGSSTGKDGAFRIANIPAATYELVVSRIGYDRQTLALQIAKSESLYYEIKLLPRPLRSKEVEILGERAEVPKPHIKYRELFFPLNAPDTYCIYGTGSTIPIGVFFADSGLYMYAIDTAIIDSEKYIRLWLLYKNFSQTAYVLDPLKCLKLQMVSAKHAYRNIPPDPPSNILAHLNNDQLLAATAGNAGNALQILALQTRHLRVVEERFFKRNGGGVWGIDDISAARGASPEILYSIFEMSMRDGVLKAHTVFPANSVNGFVYFPFPGLNWKVGSGAPHDGLEYRYFLEILTQTGSKIIEFIPTYSE